MTLLVVVRALGVEAICWRCAKHLHSRTGTAQATPNFLLLSRPMHQSDLSAHGDAKFHAYAGERGAFPKGSGMAPKPHMNFQHHMWTDEMHEML